jgi:hypothetical protein
MTEETKLEKFARENAAKAKAVQRPIIRRQEQAFPNFLTFMIGRALGIVYQPIVQVTHLDGAVFTEHVELLK